MKGVAFVAGFLTAVWLSAWLYWLTFDWYGWLDDWARLPFFLTCCVICVAAPNLCAKAIK